MLEGAKYIRELFDNDEFQPILIQGGHGYGKTSYAHRLISEVYAFKNNDKPYWNWEFFERHMGFAPEEVLREWILKKKRDHVYHWDDAGLWLHSLDFQDLFVKDVGKYMQVVRTDWACIIFSTISVDDIARKIRGLRNAIIVDITKDGSSRQQPHIRTANAYILRKGYKGRFWKDDQWKDRFNNHVPDQFYLRYKPKRDLYTDMAKNQASFHWNEKLFLEKEKKDRIEAEME